MQYLKKARLVLQDGTMYEGTSFGYEKSVSGEVVFYTAMTGYPESLTDPSYKGQILVPTYPMIGNYGVPIDKREWGISKYFESDRIHCTALVISDYSSGYSHWNSQKSLGQWLQEQQVPGLFGIDTRALTKKLREHGTMLGRIELDDSPVPFFDPNGSNIVAEVSTPEVVEDIQRHLRFPHANVFRMSFERKNLAYVVRRTEDKARELLHILGRVPGSAIVYVRNRRRTKEVAEWLAGEGITADYYHAGLDDAAKDLRQHRWQRGESRVIVATNAFGMGIDKPDVRLVVHLDLPDSIEAYFQEAGRAGRDGQKAYAVILYGRTDKGALKHRIPDTFPDKDYIKEVYEHLQYYYQMAMGDGLGCVREFDIEDFCRKFKYFPVPVDSALRILTQAGYLDYTDEQDNASRLLFTVRRDELYRHNGLGDEADRLIRLLLRLYTGLFTDYAFIDEGALATRTGLSRHQVYESLLRLSRLGIVHYVPRKKIPHITYTRERTELSRLHIPPAVYEERKQRYEARVNAMLEYVDNDTACRSRLLLRYFGEKNEHDCGQCDTCLALRNRPKDDTPPPEEIRRRILQAVSARPLTPAEVSEAVPVPADALAEALRDLLDERRLVRENGLLKMPM